MVTANHTHALADSRDTQWPVLCKRIARTAKRRNLLVLWPEAAASGGHVSRQPLGWGLRALQGDIPVGTMMAASVAAGEQIPRRLRGAIADSLPSDCEFDMGGIVEQYIDRLSSSELTIELAAQAVVWAYAMPRLAIDLVMTAPDGDTANTNGREAVDWLPEDLWWNLLGELQSIQRSAQEQLPPEAPERLLAAGEIGAILAWQLNELPSCEALREPALEAITDWYDAEGDAVSAAVHEGGRKVRATLASALRSRRLANRMKRRINIKRSGAAVDLATWAAAMTRADGSVALGKFGAATEDTDAGGLLDSAARDVGGPALKTAFDATMGRTKCKGKLAWQVQLPEPGWFDDDAGLAVMLPEWDVSRGRLALRFKDNDLQTALEIRSGKQRLITGIWDARVWKNDQRLQPINDWQDVCWYSDDDVHYLEIEQQFDGGLKIQRQVLMLRDDRCLMLADAVLADDDCGLRYEAELPLANSVHVEQEHDTRELTLVDGKRRAVVLPLALGEWKVGPTAGALRVVDNPADTAQADSDVAESGLNLVMEMRGARALYAPLWIDLERKRIRRPRTWRQLTVGERLRLVPRNQAGAFRIHAGDDQWVVYRSLNGQQNRTFLGKNLISDFFCGRFDAEDGSIEELVSVDEQPD
jgi:hypothetical protein